MSCFRLLSHPNRHFDDAAAELASPKGSLKQSSQTRIDKMAVLLENV